MTDRITYDDNGELDEIVASGGAHLERTDTNTWCLLMRNADGSEVVFLIEGKVLRLWECPPSSPPPPDDLQD